MAIKALKYITSESRDGGGRSATMTYDYINRLCQDAEQEEVLGHGSNNLPAWAKTEREFWSAADSFERKNGHSCKHLTIALPQELGVDKWEEAIQEFLKTHLKDVPSSYAIHQGKGHNPHVHIIHSTRSKALTKEENMKVWTGTSLTCKKQFFKRNGARKDKPLIEKKGLCDAHRTWVTTVNRHLDKNSQLNVKSRCERWHENQQYEEREKTVLGRLQNIGKKKHKLEEAKYMPQWRYNRARQKHRKNPNKTLEHYVAIERQQYEFYKMEQRNEGHRSEGEDRGTPARHSQDSIRDADVRRRAIESAARIMQDAYRGAKGRKDFTGEALVRHDQWLRDVIARTKERRRTMGFINGQLSTAKRTTWEGRERYRKADEKSWSSRELNQAIGKWKLAEEERKKKELQEYLEQEKAHASWMAKQSTYDTHKEKRELDERIAYAKQRSKGKPRFTKKDRKERARQATTQQPSRRAGSSRKIDKSQDLGFDF